MTSPIYEWSTTEISDIWEHPEKYQQYPYCQRLYVWKRIMQQKFIDSIFKGYPMPPIILLGRYDELRGKWYEILDGQQRIKTVIRYLKDRFATAGRFRDEPLETPYVAKRRFSELDSASRNLFLSASLPTIRIGIPTSTIHDNDEDIVGTIFRRLQYAVPLNLSERLWSYLSPARRQGEQLIEHEFWSKVYQGNTDRLQIYQMVLMLMFMEMYDIFVNMTTSRLLDMASGRYIGQNIPPNLHQTISHHLALATHAYQGATAIAMSHIIPIYQSILLLSQDGVDIRNVDIGAFASWFNYVREEGLKRQEITQRDPFIMLTRVKHQRAFWEKRLPELYDIPGLIKLDSRRTFDTTARLIAWRTQDGRCPVCHKPVSINDEAHHIKDYQLGGETTENNCVLVHSKCHNTLHL